MLDCSDIYFCVVVRIVAKSTTRFYFVIRFVQLISQLFSPFPFALESDDAHDTSSCNLHSFTLALSSCKKKGEQLFSWLCFFVISLDDTSDSFSSSGLSHSGEDRQDIELPPQDTRTPWQVGQLCPGSYCRYRYHPLEREQREGDWNPKASKGIVVPKGTTTRFYGE